MNDLLQHAIDAHGGMKRWNQLAKVSADLETGGVLWALKGQPGFAGHSRVTVDIHQQRASHYPFLAEGLRSRVEPERVAIETAEGNVVEARSHPRSTFHGHVLETPWDPIQLAYFAGYAMWTYLTAPFCFLSERLEVSEVSPWRQDGETWRALLVRFPTRIATHSAEQTFFFGSDGLLRRHDYEVEVSGGSRASHYVSSYKEFEGIMIPTRRRVFMRDERENPLPEPLVVSIDLSRVEFSFRSDVP